MVQSMTSQSIAHHNHSDHSHHPTQGFHVTHPNNQHGHQMHSNLTNGVTPVASSSQSTHQKPRQENDEEAIAKKKKNADAQAAFRQRRQTYIKSLEDTVGELRSAVTQMEAIVKTTSQEAKLNRQQVEFLESRLAAYENGERPQHCRCCKFATQDFNPDTTKDHHTKPLATPTTSAVPINSDCPSIVNPSHNSQEGISREWPPRQAIPSIFQTGASSRSIAQDACNDPPQSTKSLDYPRNILHHHSSSPLLNPPYQRSSCDLALFTPFGATDNSSVPHFYSVNEGNHAASAQSAPHNTSPSGVCNSLELAHHPTHLQPILCHSYDRSPPLRQPNSLGATYSPLGASQQFDPHHSGTLSSPRMWSSSNQNNAPAGSEPHSGAHLDGSPRPGLYTIDGSAADSGPSGFRMHHSINERSIMRSADYLPSLEHRGVPQSYPMIPSLVSPGADASSDGISFKLRSNMPKRRREWGNDKFDIKPDTRETDDLTSPTKPNGVGKLNGLPAKVAQCAQVVLEATKSLSHAKEECQALTAAPSSTISATHHSVSPNSTVSNGFIESPDPSRDNSKFHRVKLTTPNHQLVSSSSTLAPPHSQPHDEQQNDHNNHRRYQSLIGS